MRARSRTKKTPKKCLFMHVVVVVVSLLRLLSLSASWVFAISFCVCYVVVVPFFFALFSTFSYSTHTTQQAKTHLNPRKEGRKVRECLGFFMCRRKVGHSRSKWGRKFIVLHRFTRARRPLKLDEPCPSVFVPR